MTMRNADNILRLATLMSVNLATLPAGRIGLDNGLDFADERVETITDLLGGSSTTTHKVNQHNPHDTYLSP